MKDTDANERLLLELTQRSSAAMFEGYPQDDRNLRGNLLLMESSETVYSLPKAEILHQEEISCLGASQQEGAPDQPERQTKDEEGAPRRVRVWVRVGAQAFRINQFRAGESPVAFTAGMENIPLPPPPDAPGTPAPAFGGGGAAAMEHIPPPAPPDAPDTPAPGGSGRVGLEQEASLAGLEHGIVRAAPAVATIPLSWVGANWWNSCAGGDYFANNCAHFLSDAFIRAGYTELMSYGARCYTWARRPIRAREMWAWFASKATSYAYYPQPNTGWWAVFQLDERVYWGGHVALLDSDSWVYYGTGWYPYWNQYLYRW